MKKGLLRRRLSYWFDCLMSRGTAAMIMLLFGITLAAMGILGLLSCLLGGESGLFTQMWVSLMHALDAGTLAGDSTANVPYLIIMTLATLCGLFITSMLIGIVSTGFENKLNNLRKGTSTVLERGHTVIVGFNGNIYTLLNELIEANSNHKDSCIVVIGEQEKEEMEDAIADHFPDTRTTRIICRSGCLHEAHMMERASVENCRSVIVNVYDDAETIKIILAITCYLKDKTLLYPNLHYTAAVQDAQNVDAARIAGEGRAEVIFAADAISRIIAHTCRQHGLSRVMVELFNYSGNELYFERVPELTGKTFRRALNCFSNATVFGLRRGDSVQLNPPMDTVIRSGDEVVLLEEDDGAFIYDLTGEVDESAIFRGEPCKYDANDHLLILGSNNKLPKVLEEYDRYVLPGTRVMIVDEDLDPKRIVECKNLQIFTRTCPITRSLLLELLEGEVDNVLILNDDSGDAEYADAQTLQRLIYLKDIAQKTGKRFSITSEMQRSDNQRLAAQVRVDDFVIGSNIINLLMAQIAENRLLEPLFEDLLDEEGSELYMKPASNYVKTGVPVNFYTLTQSAARYGEIFVGYKCIREGQTVLNINPDKKQTITLEDGDWVIVIAEN